MFNLLARFAGGLTQVANEFENCIIADGMKRIHSLQEGTAVSVRQNSLYFPIAYS